MLCFRAAVDTVLLPRQAQTMAAHTIDVSGFRRGLEGTQLMSLAVQQCLTVSVQIIQLAQRLTTSPKPRCVARWKPATTAKCSCELQRLRLDSNGSFTGGEPQRL